MFGLMFGMGLALSPADFRRIAKVPGPVIAGTILQLIVMPGLGVGLALAFDLPPMLAVGLVIIAGCPGGMMSNMLVHYGRANTALSITLTATATTATLLTLPLWIRFILSRVASDNAAVEVPLLATALQLGGLTVLPVILGMALRMIRPRSVRLERPLTVIAAVGIIGNLARDAAMRPELPTAEFVASLPPTVCLALASVALGLGIPRVLGQPARDAVAIAVELCVKNGLFGLVVVGGTFSAFAPNIPIFVYSGLMVPVAAALLTIHSIREVRVGRRSLEKA